MISAKQARFQTIEVDEQEQRRDAVFTTHERKPTHTTERRLQTVVTWNPQITRGASSFGQAYLIPRTQKARVVRRLRTQTSQLHETVT